MKQTIGKSIGKAATNPASAVEAVFDAYPRPVKAIAGTSAADLRHREDDKRRRRAGRDAEMGAAELPHAGNQERQHDPDRPDQTRARAICLVETFRELYPELRYEGNRAILLGAQEKLPEAALRHCVALALTYHLGKRKGGETK